MTDASEAPTPLLHPRDGLPPVVADADALGQIVRTFAAGSGPVAVDAERASGYRYSHRAYLIQLRREGAGSALVDPIACPDLSELNAVLADAEWVLHAASQDLPCLRQVGLAPNTLFDTELAGRLLGFPRVGLAALVERMLGYQLEKGHAAVDWSTRPLPEPWLVYAALDVEVLVELRDALAAELEQQDKSGWAREEFAAILALPDPAPRTEPWRRTSGIHRVRSRRQIAHVRELWNARDEIAQQRDISPGRVLPDAAIVSAATTRPATRAELEAIPAFRGRGSRRYLSIWWQAVERARHLPESALPEMSAPAEGPPPPRAWLDHDPQAAHRLAACRTTLADLAATHTLPVENLLTPDYVRRLAWDPPPEPTADAVATALADLGARPWQVQLTAAPLCAALIEGDQAEPTQPGAKGVTNETGTNTAPDDQATAEQNTAATSNAEQDNVRQDAGNVGTAGTEDSASSPQPAAEVEPSRHQARPR